MSDSIDDELLAHYQRELTWLRHAGAGFAERYPKVAQRLELGADECNDPHVERLLEGFAFLTARLQRRLDDDYAQFSDALLEQLYPHALRPFPSCAIAQFTPDLHKGNLAQGYPIARGTPLFTTVNERDPLAQHGNLHGQTLHFRTTDHLTLWPIEITEARLLDAEETCARLPLDYPAQTKAPRSALRIVLQCLEGYDWPSLEIERLRIHLSSASSITNALLYDLLGAHATGITQGPSEDEQSPLDGSPVAVGFAAGQSLLPEDDCTAPGLQLLAEYFTFPEKFAFFDLPIQAGKISGRQLCIHLLFAHEPPRYLDLQAGDLALGCVPVVNLFSRISEPLRPDGTRSEYRLVADAYREEATEIHSIRNLQASGANGARPMAPYHGWQHAASGAPLYWHARRVQGMTPGRQGSDLLLSLVDNDFNPREAAAEQTLSAELLCTNRHLAERLPAGTQLHFERPGPVGNVHLRKTPSRQYQPALDGPSRWRLVSQLTLNHASLSEGPRALEALREMLALHNLSETPEAFRQIQGIEALDCRRVTEHRGDDAWRGWQNGLEVRLRLKPESFTGSSAVLFSAVLAQFFSLHANANRFVRTVLVQADQEIALWRPQAGQPLVV
ncbi:type VI secretion system baseplate subunit TssF [Stutzerimonas kirkiae]|uniref:type VI secretion system baseplate subunit TssF n=1 Tax=Stutzerimonas kirkiae TaxID=2211392 RepID=UPI0010383B1A|nr:type VI secretion system baseplate subunit TssF [Stutzerimonas kirkiae]TBV14601.1 type VI secretion system baseplate subunit TssF [Stutzerimonas kirkiae]